MNKFVLLKQTFPISQYDRPCDGYKYIMENISSENRVTYDINDNDLQKIIHVGERYLYRVGKENGIFKIMSISLSNFEILRKKYFGFEDNK